MRGGQIFEMELGFERVQHYEKGFLPARARMSSHFIEFEFHRVSNCRVRTCIMLEFCLSISSSSSRNMSFSGFLSSNLAEFEF